MLASNARWYVSINIILQHVRAVYPVHMFFILRHDAFVSNAVFRSYCFSFGRLLHVFFGGKTELKRTLVYHLTLFNW